MRQIWIRVALVVIAVIAVPLAWWAERWKKEASKTDMTKAIEAAIAYSKTPAFRSARIVFFRDGYSPPSNPTKTRALRVKYEAIP